MKNQLTKWGFDPTVKAFDTGIEVFEKSQGLVTVRVVLSHGTLKLVQLVVGDTAVDVPNCNSKLGLLTLLYQLNLIEV